MFYTILILILGISFNGYALEQNLPETQIEERRRSLTPTVDCSSAPSVSERSDEAQEEKDQATPQNSPGLVRFKPDVSSGTVERSRVKAVNPEALAAAMSLRNNKKK